MSATVAPLAYDELFWFFDGMRRRYHAFELVNGELQARSICEDAAIDSCSDLPCLNTEERKNRGCLFCMTLAVVVEPPEDE